MDRTFDNNFIKIGKELSMTAETIVEYNIDVLIEAGTNSTVSYKYDEIKRAMVCVEIMDYPFKSHFNFGVIPKTLNPYNSEIDVIIVMDNSLIPGSYINCKLVGCCEIKNNHTAKKPYLIMCPTEKIDYKFREFNDIGHLDISIMNKLQYMLLYRHSLCYSGRVNEMSVEFNDKQMGIKLYETALKRYGALI
mgnify:CR=1 FL=1|tara:strand:+ start:2090 stop:2665 length:576 start_codon:yes stop_codon:yes gene_type:complete